MDTGETWALNGHLFLLWPSSLQKPHRVCFSPWIGDLAYFPNMPNFSSSSVSFLGDSDQISSFVLPSDSLLAWKFNFFRFIHKIIWSFYNAHCLPCTEEHIPRRSLSDFFPRNHRLNIQFLPWSDNTLMSRFVKSWYVTCCLEILVLSFFPGIFIFFLI